ncbi:MAG: glycosyltransferase family 4 protein [bacterium]|nr:glycosyltransferase family 4 protein [bacterium]
MIQTLVSTSTFPLGTEDALPRFVYDLAEALAEHCRVTALTPDVPGIRRQELIGRVDVRRFPYFYPRRLQLLAYGYGMRENLRAHPISWLQVLPFVLAQTLATRRLTREKQIDVVNSHWMIPQGLSTALAGGRGRRFRHVLSVHAGDVYMLGKLPLGRTLARFILRRSDALFADGSHVSEHLDRLLGYPAGAAIQPMGAHLGVFRDGPRLAAAEIPFADGYLLFVGRFNEKKGTVYLLRALPGVLARHPGLGLVLVGYGPDEDSLRRETVRLGIEDSVVFAGARPHREIGRYLRSCRLAVVPSIIDRHGETEGMPTVVIEAMSAGTRVVASAVDGIPDVVRHGHNGWLCREKDPADLAEKILVALDDPASSPVLEAVRETAESFAWPRVARRYLETFERLLRSGGGGSTSCTENAPTR